MLGRHLVRHGCRSVARARRGWPSNGGESNPTCELMRGRTPLQIACSAKHLHQVGRLTPSEAQPVVLLGHAALRTMCEPCGDDDLESEKAALVATLEAFRQANGFGRGIAAPQIGVTRRFIAVNMGDDHPVVRNPPRVLSDPVVTWRSPETFTLFDDCMSLPWILCAVRRHESISVEFTNEDGEREQWSEVDKPLSELLQHELDHLDGVLNIDLALPQGVVSREVFDQDPSAFKSHVDYFIEPTI